MTTWEAIARKARDLPAEKQLEVLDFVDFLGSRGKKPSPRKEPAGLWADLGIEITDDDIEEARRESWGNFPRKDI